ncbi:hypothetical protein [Bacteroides sp.]|uniref:hypothetical protein n=1 Tax=Bacteroides sp. TaxID=29523 RepID=UPI00260457F4|nr:hypothetical protein [Bacteroides sp.]
MKTIFNKLTLICILTMGCLFTGCSNDHDEWEDGDPDLAHVYYYCFEQWGGNNEVAYSVAQGETIAIPTQFMSSFTRSYSPEVYYYTSAIPPKKGETVTDLICGTDYVVVDKDGKTLPPDASGAYKMTWPNAKKGVQDIYIKTLNGKKGSFRVLTFDPTKKIDVTDVNTTSIIKTDEYEVRAISENYYVTVVIK